MKPEGALGDSFGDDCLIHVEWGLRAVSEFAERVDVVVIADVLSFSTSVEIAISRGATVYPFPSKSSDAERFAKSQGAILAARRGQGGFSLSPASLLNVQPETRLVLPSPNGATLSLAAGRTPVLAGCLRNASAVAAAASAMGDRVLVVPAGERWPDDSLRPALEDWLGAGAVLAGMTGPFTSEAEACRDSFRASRSNLPALLRQCGSGTELLARGYGDDVALAAEVDVSAVVPWLQDGAYRPLSQQPSKSARPVR